MRPTAQAVTKCSSSAAHSPRSRRSRSRRPWAAKAAAISSASCDEQAGGDQRRAAASASRRGVVEQQRAQQVRERPSGAAGIGSLRRSQRRDVERDAVDGGVVARRLDATAGRSRPPSPARSRASRPRSRARRSRSRGRAAGRARAASASVSSSSRHSRVVACAPVPNACAGSITSSTSAPSGCLPRRAHGEPLAEHERLVELLPALGPVVRQLARRDLDQRAADRSFEVGQHRQLARRPVDRVLDAASPRSTSSTPPGASSSSSASATSACARSTRSASRIMRRGRARRGRGGGRAWPGARRACAARVSVAACRRHDQQIGGVVAAPLVAGQRQRSPIVLCDRLRRRGWARRRTDERADALTRSARAVDVAGAQNASMQLSERDDGDRRLVGQHGVAVGRRDHERRVDQRTAHPSFHGSSTGG